MELGGVMESHVSRRHCYFQPMAAAVRGVSFLRGCSPCEIALAPVNAPTPLQHEADSDVI